MTSDETTPASRRRRHSADLSSSPHQPLSSAAAAAPGSLSSSQMTSMTDFPRCKPDPPADAEARCTTTDCPHVSRHYATCNTLYQHTGCPKRCCHILGKSFSAGKSRIIRFFFPLASFIKAIFGVTIFYSSRMDILRTERKNVSGANLISRGICPQMH